MITEFYDQWLSEGVHQFTESMIMKFPLQEKNNWMSTWRLVSLSKENIKSFKCCGLNIANDGTEDDFIHCLKKGQPCKVGRQKPNSQLSILVDEIDVVNPFTSPSDEEDANEDVNVIEDETDKEIIM